MVKSSPHRRLIALQKQIYLSLKQEASCLMGPLPPSIRRYEREYQRDFARASFSPSSRKKLVSEVLNSRLTLIGDFHTFSQTQRTALRVLRDCVAAGKKSRWVLGLELIPSHYQKELNRFSSGEFSLRSFLERIHYEQEWGFPWQNYAPLLEWARSAGVELLALNRPREVRLTWGSRPGTEYIAGESDLQERDRWAAGILVDRLKEGKESQECGSAQDVRILAIFGELHLSHGHLPSQIEALSEDYLKQPLSPVVIHQNHDALYWKLAQEKKEFKHQVLKLKGSARYCVISGTPWSQLQSLINWAEGSSDDSPEQQVREEDSLYDDHLPDYLSQIRSYGHIVSDFLKIEPPSFAELSVKSLGEADFLDRIGSKLSPSERAVARFFVRHNLRLHIAGAEILYLGTPTENRSAELACAHIFRSCNRDFLLFSRDEEAAPRLVLESAFSFFGSLIINPRRKCDLPADHQKRIRELSRGAKPLFSGEAIARRMGLDLFKGKALGKKASKPELVAIGSRYAGQMLGHLLFQGFLEGRIQQDWIKALLLRRGPYCERAALLRERIRLPGPSASKSRVF